MGSPRDDLIRALSEILVPLLQVDGGTIFLVSADDHAVELHLGGRYAGCPGNTLTVRRVIEPALRAVVADVRVTVTSGALIPEGCRRLTAAGDG
jgi:Fe-S cluster biogenesis protein NfuA